MCTGPACPEQCSPRFHFNWISIDEFLYPIDAHVQSDVLQGSTSMESLLMCSGIFRCMHRSGVLPPELHFNENSIVVPPPIWEFAQVRTNGRLPMFHFNWISINIFSCLQRWTQVPSLEWCFPSSPRLHFNGILTNILLAASLKACTCS